MQTSGPLPVLPSTPASTQETLLRVNQRVSAEVVEVAGTRVVLSINGMPIVARLDPADQGAQLAERRIAQFVVTSLAEGEIVLKLAENVPAKPAVSVGASAADVAASVLHDLGIEGTPPNLILARAALSQHLTLTPALMEELSAFLGGVGAWGEAEAALAAAIKAAGLPLTSGLFQRAAQSHPSLGASIADLITTLQNVLQHKNLSAEARQVLTDGLGVLARAVIEWGAPGGTTPSALEALAKTYGQSIEHALLALQKEGGQAPEGKGILELARMRQFCADHPELGLGEKTRRLMGAMEQNLLSNLRLDPVPGQGEWCGLQFVLQNPPPQQPVFLPAQVRIARREGDPANSIDGASTRLLISVDVRPSESVLVDLTLVGDIARAVVVTPNAELQQRSQEEMPALVDALRAMGIRIGAADFPIGHPSDSALVSVLPPSAAFNRRVNMKV